MIAFSSPDKGAAGNTCNVYLLDGPLQPPFEATDDTTYCVTWATDHCDAAVRCWTEGGQAIACCGHGLLSCASLWLERWGMPGTLHMGATRVPCYRDEHAIWMRFPCLDFHPAEVPQWLGLFFTTLPEAAAYVGAESGYWILRWPAGFPLETLSQPGAALAKHTQRALVVTCAVQPSGDHGEAADILYRYFAPQYGVTEDAATGSAMRLLVNYWEHCGLGNTITAYQCSEKGGWLKGRMDKEFAWVGGTVTAAGGEGFVINE